MYISLYAKQCNFLNFGNAMQNQSIMSLVFRLHLYSFLPYLLLRPEIRGLPAEIQDITLEQ